MRILVAGLTGQLGAGVVEAAEDLGFELIPVVRSLHGHRPEQRLERLFADLPRLREATVEGDVTLPRWGLDDCLDRLAPEVDAVLNVAAETNWAAPARRLTAVNVLGAVNGRRLAAALTARHPRCAAYCYASSVFAAGGRTGLVPEDRFGPERNRTAYEQSKWLAEEALLNDPGEEAPPLAIARIGGLLGNSRTGATARRHSLYLLADRLDHVVGRVLPLDPRGRVDMLPREQAGEALLRFVGSAVRLACAEPLIAHVCAGESAPTTRSLFDTLRALDVYGRVSRPRLVPLPGQASLVASNQLERFRAFPPRWRNAIEGMRYLTLDRVFERERLARLLAGQVPSPPVELIVRLAFGLDPGPGSRAASPSLARFAG